MKVEAVIVVSNDAAIEILGIEHGIEDYVKYRWAVAGTYSKPIKSRIRYDEHDTYFMSRGTKHSLSEAVKVNG